MQAERINREQFIQLSDDLILNDVGHLEIMEVDQNHSEFLWDKSVDGFEDVEFFKLSDGNIPFGFVSFTSIWKSVRAFYIDRNYRDRKHVEFMMNFLRRKLGPHFTIGCTHKNTRMKMFAERNKWEVKYSDDLNVLYACQ